jgi:hypothetical protein
MMDEVVTHGGLRWRNPLSRKPDADTPLAWHVIETTFARFDLQFPPIVMSGQLYGRGCSMFITTGQSIVFMT